MITLLVNSGAVSEAASIETVFGGRPTANDGFVWPTCRTCEGHMQFLAQLRAPGSGLLLLLFMCQNDPGMCDEWDANMGGNAVVCIPAGDLNLIDAPEDGECVRPTRYGARLLELDAPSYEKGARDWAKESDCDFREVLGQLGGTPEWIQGDETPDCDDCGTPMAFVAQLEEGPDHLTSMNFGGGAAYVFHCRCKAGTGKILWQC